VLEHAERGPGALDQRARLDPALAQGHHLARLDLAQQLGADDVERARLAGHAVAVAKHAQAQGTQARRVAERDHAVAGHDHGGEGALQAGDDVGQRVLEPLGLVGREQGGDDLRVRRGPERHPALAQLGVQRHGVDQVAVVGERQLAVVGAVDRLRVLPGAGAGGGVAHVADRHVALEGAQALLAEDLVDQPQLALGHDVAALHAGDPRGLLAAVLKRVEREVRESRDVVVGREDAEDAALVARSLTRIELGVHWSGLTSAPVAVRSTTAITA
jgi:hypothetical protein